MLTVNLTVQRNPNGHQELCKALCTSPIFWVSSFRISPLASILPNFMPPPITNQEQKNTTTQKQKHATQLELQKKNKLRWYPQHPEPSLEPCWT